MEEFPEGVVAFRIAALGGQLRWRSETGPVVGDLSIPKGLQHFPFDEPRVRAHVHDVLRYAAPCPESPGGRTGRGTPVFWMDLAGSWAINGNIQPIYQRPGGSKCPRTCGSRSCQNPGMRTSRSSSYAVS